MTEVVLYTRPDCHLCDEARAVIERVHAELSFTLTEHDIDGDDALLRAYLERIPVVAINGVEAFEYFVDEADFRAWLARVQQA